MRHTVIGVFDTYVQAEQARSALTAAGFSHGDIELQANPKRDDAAEPSLAPDAETHAEPGVLANIERFFSMLFGGRDQPPEVAHYSEAVRRGAVLIAVDTNTEAEVDIARTTLADQGAVDIDERAASWGALAHGATATEDDRDHSILDELGLGRGSAVPGRDPLDTERSAARADLNRARAYPRADVGDPAVEPMLDPLGDPLGNPLRPQDPATLSSRDIFTETPAEPLGPLDMPATREDSLARGTAGRDPLTAENIGSPAQRDSLSPTSLSERDALVGADPLAPLKPAAPASDTRARDALGERDALTGRDPLSAGNVGTPAQRDPISPASGSPATPASDALGGRDATYRYDPQAQRDMPSASGRSMEGGSVPGGPLPGTSAESARDWRPVNSLDETDAAANDAFAPRVSEPDAPDAARMGAPSASGRAPGALGPQTIPDEYMEYSDDFRSDYDSKYATTGSPYEDYEGAYRYGANLGNDERFRSRQWDDQMEYELQRDWESRHPEGGDTWDRFKAAIRHGWDRVTGHHHV
jgi:hypothetical protein